MIDHGPLPLTTFPPSADCHSGGIRAMYPPPIKRGPTGEVNVYGPDAWLDCEKLIGLTYADFVGEQFPSYAVLAVPISFPP
jgi:hypothetical protein